MVKLAITLLLLPQAMAWGGRVDNPVPVLTAISPSTIAPGSASQALTLTGRNFLSSSQVQFNGTPRSATYVNSSRLTLKLTAADLKSPGSYPVVVVNPPPGGGASAMAALLVQPAVSGRSRGGQ
jgi:trimeric autotransporter adhesin